MGSRGVNSSHSERAVRACDNIAVGYAPSRPVASKLVMGPDAQLRGAPSGHVVNIREVRLAAGAEFVVMICGDIMTMPGLPRVPAANNIDVDENGRIVGLF